MHVQQLVAHMENRHNSTLLAAPVAHLAVVQVLAVVALKHDPDLGHPEPQAEGNGKVMPIGIFLSAVSL